MNSIIVKFPAEAGIGERYSTIRATPEAGWAYIFAVAPQLYREAGRCKKLAGRNGWQYDEARVRRGCMLIIEGKVQEHEEPRPIRWHVPFHLVEWHYELATVDGWSVRAFGPGPRARVYCTCHDITAPKCARADYTCEHIIAWALHTPGEGGK